MSGGSIALGRCRLDLVACQYAVLTNFMPEYPLADYCGVRICRLNKPLNGFLSTKLHRHRPAPAQI